MTQGLHRRAKAQRTNGPILLANARVIVAPGASGEELEASGMDMLMWVGYTGYPTVEAFSHEAKKIGISKRISRIPSNLVPGATRLWIVHDSGEAGRGTVIGYGIITGVDVLGELPEDAPDYARSITKAEAWREPTRGGQLRRAGIYLIADRWTPIRPREAKKIDRFRSYKWVSRRRMEMLPIAEAGALPEPVEPSHRWSQEEIDGFVGRAKVVGPYQAAKEHARLSERSLEACMYQWKQYKKRQAR